MKKQIAPSPKILNEGFDGQGLRFITLQIRKREITVTEPRFGIDRARARFITEVLALPDMDEEERNYVLLNYSSAAPVSSGDVPKASDVIQMADADVKFWIEQARKVAPSLFDWEDDLKEQNEQEQKEVTKKKGRKR